MTAFVDQDSGDPTARGGSTTWRTIMLVMMAFLGVVTLVALIAILSGANRQRDRALELQAHSYDVMILARTLSATIARSEASLGRYVISGDKVSGDQGLGQLYFDQWRLANSQLDRLDKLTHDNARHRARIAALREAFSSRGEELALIALNTNYGRNNMALSRYYGARKAQSLRRIDDTLKEIIRGERILLGDRTSAAMETVDRASHIAGALAVFGVLLVLGGIMLGWMTMNAIGERATARADAEMQRARAEELTAAVAKATGELRVQEAKLRQIQKMEAVGQLTGGIAHDFNNMLAVVLGGLELARRHVLSDPENAQRNIENAMDGANRAAALTRRLLAFSREESLKPEAIVAGELVSGMTDLLDRTLGDAITLVARDTSMGWRVRADRVQLENAVLNLAVNARDAMSGRGVLTIATGVRTLAAEEVNHNAAGDYVTIAVTDTGHGMTQDVADRVFEPFFTTKEVGKGTGLGLSQIFGFVRQLSGEIVIASAPGAGTTVTVYLPRDTSMPDAVAIVEAAPMSSDEPEALRILVVEDDPRVLGATMGALEELGHHAIACDDPLAAGEALSRHPDVDLIITDVLMPRQTGPEMIAGLAPRFPHVAVLFVTGFAGEANAAEFGDHQVLRKPFTLAGLERAIAAAMQTARPAHPARIAAE